MSKKRNPRSKLIAARKEKGFTQEQMAKLLKITRATYTNYENGYREPCLNRIIEIKNILGISSDEFFLQDSDTKRV